MTRGATHRDLGHTLLLFLPGAYTRACWAWNRRSLRIAGEAPTTHLGRPLVGLCHMPILVKSLCCLVLSGLCILTLWRLYWWQCQGCYRFTLLFPSSRHPTNSQPCNYMSLPWPNIAATSTLRLLPTPMDLSPAYPQWGEVQGRCRHP